MKDRIKQLMETQHMTQQVFADFLGINPATLSGIFNDRTKPTLNIVEAVKKKFPDINLDWLLFGTGPIFGSSNAAPAVESAPTVSSQAAPSMTSMSQEPMLDFGAPSSPAPARDQMGISAPSHINSVRNTRPEFFREEVKIVDKHSRRVTEIRVYYDDQTWESFVPAKK